MIPTTQRKHLKTAGLSRKLVSKIVNNTGQRKRGGVYIKRSKKKKEEDLQDCATDFRSPKKCAK